MYCQCKINGYLQLVKHIFFFKCVIDIVLFFLTFIDKIIYQLIKKILYSFIDNDNNCLQQPQSRYITTTFEK